MSARIQVATPLLNEEILLNCLENLKVKYTIAKNKIILSDYFSYRETSIEQDRNGKYIFNYESELNSQMNKLIEKIQSEYQKISEVKRLKEEEEAKKEYVKKRKEEIIAKAKMQGYTVKEKVKDNKVHLILQRLV